MTTKLLRTRMFADERKFFYDHCTRVGESTSAVATQVWKMYKMNHEYGDQEYRFVDLRVSPEIHQEVNDWAGLLGIPASHLVRKAIMDAQWHLECKPGREYVREVLRLSAIGV